MFEIFVWNGWPCCCRHSGSSGSPAPAGPADRRPGPAVRSREGPQSWDADNYGALFQVTMHNRYIYKIKRLLDHANVILSS